MDNSPPDGELSGHVHLSSGGLRGLGKCHWSGQKMSMSVHWPDYDHLVKSDTSVNSWSSQLQTGRENPALQSDV